MMCMLTHYQIMMNLFVCRFPLMFMITLGYALKTPNLLFGVLSIEAVTTGSIRLVGKVVLQKLLEIF